MERNNAEFVKMLKGLNAGCSGSMYKYTYYNMEYNLREYPGDSVARSPQNQIEVLQGLLDIALLNKNITWAKELADDIKSLQNPQV